MGESIVSIVSYVFISIKAGCAWSWTRAPISAHAWCMPRVVVVVEIITLYQAQTGRCSATTGYVAPSPNHVQNNVHGIWYMVYSIWYMVYAACVIAFVACVNADKFSVVYLILLKSPVHGHGRGMSFSIC